MPDYKKLYQELYAAIYDTIDLLQQVTRYTEAELSAESPPPIVLADNPPKE